MPTIFDAHSHIFPSMLHGEYFDDNCLKETQYHVRFPGPGGYRRVRDNEPLLDPIMVSERDGISWSPELNFRIGWYGRVLITYKGEDYYFQHGPPSYADLSSPPEQVIAQMDFAGIDRAVIQHDRLYGRLDDYLGDALCKFPDRLVALAQVDEWRAGEPDELERLKHEVEDLGFSGLYFSTGGFCHNDFAFGINDDILEPLWTLVADLGIPIHWMAANRRQPRLQQYLHELTEFARWGRAHPDIPSVLTHGLENLRIDIDRPDRFEVPQEIIELISLPNWHIELMIHKMLHDVEFAPYHTPAAQVIRDLADSVGANKLMWGSDMPGCEKVTTYRQARILYETQTDFLGDDERAGLMGGNVERLYPPKE